MYIIIILTIWNIEYLKSYISRRHKEVKQRGKLGLSVVGPLSFFQLAIVFFFICHFLLFLLSPTHLTIISLPSFPQETLLGFFFLFGTLLNQF